jgi:DNA-binding MarR family transcriptional regulator
MALAFQMGLALHAIGKKIRAEFLVQNIGIPPNQFGLLDFISRDKEVIQTELATLLDKDKSAVLREIDVLEEKGFIKRVNDAVDRRKKFVVITPEGKKILKKGKALIEKLMGEMMEGLPETEIESFLKVLRHLENKAKE